MFVIKQILENNLCKTCNSILNRQYIPFASFSSTQNVSLKDTDPAPFFFDSEVQKLLRKLTRVDLKKVFRKRKDEQKLSTPKYKFMTTEELNEALKDADIKAEKMLQMPPVVLPVKDCEVLIDDEPALQEFDSDNSNYIFTDITYGIKDIDRLIYVRESKGKLRMAKWDERIRMNQIYFPLPGRKLIPPRMFQDRFLKLLLDKKEYEFVLDKACIQYEPQDPDYCRIRNIVFDHVDSNNDFENLRSTRHFGPLAFHLAWNKDIDNLLLDVLHATRIDEAVSLVKLFLIINGSLFQETECNEDISFIENYIKIAAKKKDSLELAVQSYLERMKQKEEIEKGIQKAHGHL